jgi:hypothetical protein
MNGGDQRKRGTYSGGRMTTDELQHWCDAWNAAHPVGCDVTLKKDSGELLRTKTRSKAEVLSGHSAVIWLDGVRGCYLLDRVTPGHGTEPGKA